MSLTIDYLQVTAHKRISLGGLSEMEDMNDKKIAEYHEDIKKAINAIENIKRLYAPASVNVIRKIHYNTRGDIDYIERFKNVRGDIERAFLMAYAGEEGSHDFTQDSGVLSYLYELSDYIEKDLNNRSEKQRQLRDMGFPA